MKTFTIISTILLILFGYLGIAYEVHWPPFSRSTPTADITPSPYTTTSAFQTNSSLPSTVLSTAQSSVAVSYVQTQVTNVANQSVTYSDFAQKINLKANVTSNAAGTINEGKITFTITDSHGTNIGDAVWGLVINGSVNVVYSVPGGIGAGLYAINAAYSGSDRFITSNVLASLTVGKANTVIVINPISYLKYISSPQDITLTATVATSDGSIVTQGTVTFTIYGGGVVGVPVTGVVTEGVASVVYSLPANFSGSYYSQVGYYYSDYITVQYGGGDSFQPTNKTMDLP